MFGGSIIIGLGHTTAMLHNHCSVHEVIAMLQSLPCGFHTNVGAGEGDHAQHQRADAVHTSASDCMLQFRLSGLRLRTGLPANGR